MRFVKELGLGIVTCLLILVLAIASNALLDRYLPRTALQTTAQGGAACVDAQGSWVNWPWPNAPTLSPRCPDVAPASREPAEKP